MASRRQFLRAAGAGLGAAALGSGAIPSGLAGAPNVRPAAVRPVVLASGNGLGAVRRALEVLDDGGDTLEAVVEGVTLVELDPEDRSVGFGGLPNEDGVVQLDASVMHGPSRRAGAVAALEGVKTPSRVAVAVMRYTDHVLLAGDGAARFARQMGFEVHDTLLTEESRRTWLEWRTTRSDRDAWLTPGDTGAGDSPFLRRLNRPADPTDPGGTGVDGVQSGGTIHCTAVDRNGDVSGVTTTSGLPWKIPGRVGDSPIVGAGLYVDNDVGGAGSTGRGEAVIKTCGSHTVVEGMRRGMAPTDAAIEALRRIVRWTEARPRLLRPDGRPAFNVNFYAVSRDGEFGAASLWPARFAVARAGEATLRDTAHLFEEA